MKIRKVEDWNHYELLGLESSATAPEILNAYLAAVSAYHPGALASYGLVKDEERRFILERIEEAFQTLRDPAKRKAYDENLIPAATSGRVSFRKSIERVDIQDAEPRKGFIDRLQAFFKKRPPAPATPEIREPEALPYLQGEALRLVRLQRKLSLEEASRLTRINQDTLQALEAEDYGRLPKGLEPSSLLRLYARALGLDVEAG